MRLPALVFILLVAVSPVRGQQPKSTQPTKARLWASISVTDPIYDRDVMRVGEFTILFGLVNDGDKTVDPDLKSSKLVINGKELTDPVWEESIVSGPHSGKEDKLPPGDYILMGMGCERLFRKPGVYKVYWKGKEFQSPEIVFRVIPTKGK